MFLVNIYKAISIPGYRITFISKQDTSNEGNSIAATCKPLMKGTDKQIRANDRCLMDYDNLLCVCLNGSSFEFFVIHQVKEDFARCVVVVRHIYTHEMYVR